MGRYVLPAPGQFSLWEGCLYKDDAPPGHISEQWIDP